MNTSENAVEVRRRGRPRKNIEESIFPAVRNVLATSGYDELSVDDIAKTCGVAGTTIYRRWPTKAALVAAALDTPTNPHSSAPDTGNLRDDLVTLLKESFNLVTGVDNTYESLVRASARHPELGQLIRQRTHTRRNDYRRAINRSIARNEISPDTDVDTIFDLLYGPLWFRILVSGRSPLELQPEQLVDTVLKLIEPAQKP